MHLKLLVTLAVIATTTAQYGPIKKGGGKRTTTPFPPQQEYNPDLNSVGPDSYEETSGALSGSYGRPASPAGAVARPDNPWLQGVISQNAPAPGPQPARGPGPNTGYGGGSPAPAPPVYKPTPIACGIPGYVCVPSYQCQGGSTSAQGTGAIECNPDSEVCCRAQQAAPQPQPAYRPQPQPQPQPAYRPQPQTQPQPQPAYRPPAPQPSYPAPQPAPQPSYPAPQPSYPAPQPAPQPSYPAPQPAPQPAYPAPQPVAQPTYQGQPSYQQQQQPQSRPRPGYPSAPIGGSIYDNQAVPQPRPVPNYNNNYVTDAPIQRYTGPLNTTPHPGCAAALKCVEETYCTWDGVMADTPQYLTREQTENKVPLSDCQNIETGIIGKCCRDPNYKDPWPAGMMMNSGPFDDGLYHPGQSAATPNSAPFDDGQYRAPAPQPIPAPAPYAPQPQPYAPAAPQPQYTPNVPAYAAQAQPTFNSRPSGTPVQREPCGPSATCTPSNLCPGERQTQPGKACRVPNDDSTGVCCEKLQFPQSTNNQQYRPLPAEKTSTPIYKPQPGYNQPQPKPTYNKPQNGYNQPQPAFRPQPTPQLPAQVANPSRTDFNPYNAPAQLPAQLPNPPVARPPRPVNPYNAPALPPQAPNPPSFQRPASPPSAPAAPAYAPKPQPNEPVGYGAPAVPAYAPKPQPNKPNGYGAPYQPPRPAPTTARPYRPTQPITAAPTTQAPSYDAYTQRVGGITASKPVESNDITAEPEVPAQPAVATTTVKAITTTAPPLIRPKDAEEEEEEKPKAPEPEPGKECGVRRQVPRPNGPAGIETGFGEFPWQAQVISASNQKGLCSAAIMAENIVVTAASCVSQLTSSDILVKAGDWKVQSENPAEEPKPVQIKPVAAVAVHPEYNPISQFNDMAVLVLSEPLKFDSHVDKLCLGKDSAPGQPPAGKNCVVTGWGKNAAPGTPLHSIPVNFMSNDKCQDAFRSTNLGKYFQLHSSFTCALPTTPNHDLCQVDKGSPISCQKPDGNYELSGIYSWDVGCHPNTNIPAAMSKVDNQWVQSIMDKPVEAIKNEVETERKRQEELGQEPDSSDATKPGFSQGYGK